MDKREEDRLVARCLRAVDEAYDDQHPELPGFSKSLRLLADRLDPPKSRIDRIVSKYAAKRGCSSRLDDALRNILGEEGV